MMKRLAALVGAHLPQPITTELACVWGAFLMEGLMVSTSDTTRPGRILDAWSSGCIELIGEVCQAVDILWQQLQPYWLSQEPFPGVFEYEVVSELGYCIGEHLLAHREIPSPSQIEQITAELIRQFFEQAAEAAEAAANHA